MIHQLIPLTEFRLKLAALCSEVNQGKKELVVTRYSEPLFEVVKLNDYDKAEAVFGVTYVRDNPTKFVKSLRRHKTVVLSEREEPLVKCNLIDD
jgi:prevent-host-death family protein